MFTQFHVVEMARLLRNNTNKDYETLQFDYMAKYSLEQN